MKGLFFFAALLAAASAQCDNNALTTCATNYVNAVLGGVSNWADPVTGACTLLRDYFSCIYAACPGVQQEIQNALQQYDTLFNECGFILPGTAGLAGTNICLLTGDPHVLTFNRSWFDCKLTDRNEVVFSDGDNTLTVESDADVAWTDQDLTAVRYVKVVTRSGTYEMFANNTNSRFSATSITPVAGLTVNPSSIVDTTKSTWIRADRYSGNGQFWLDVIVRSNVAAATGVCKSGCPNGRRSAPLDTVLKRSVGTRNGQTVCTAAGLSGQLLANCIADVDNSNINNFANSSTNANVEIRVANDLTGVAASISYSVAVLALMALLVVFF